MELKIYQLDAFANKQFEGNPAAVCPLDQWIDDTLMQKIAAENNLSETAFFVENNGIFHIRWFTPNREVSLCGHATLASAYVIFTYLDYKHPRIEFICQSGKLFVSKHNHLLSMDFPSEPHTPCMIPNELAQAFDSRPVSCFFNQDYFLIFSSEEQILNAQPDMTLLSTIDCRGICISAPSHEYDFVSRFFAPRFGINEDPVTGSSFTALAPYWSEQLNKTSLHARQVSARGGDVQLQCSGKRVTISGTVKHYMTGTLFID